MQCTPSARTRRGKDVDPATPVLFVHGWGVGLGAYCRPIRALEKAGYRVLAPSLPGFGRTPGLRATQRTFEGFAHWLANDVRHSSLAGPFHVVGHSFGGGIALQLAHDHPDLVASLVLCNAAGGPWRAPEAKQPSVPMADRPLLNWVLSIGADLVDVLDPLTSARTLPPVISGTIASFARHPVAVWQAGQVVRSADLVQVAAEVAKRGVPINVIWSERDLLVPRACFEGLAAAAGVRGEVVAGHHNWLIADPGRFIQMVANALEPFRSAGAVSA